MRRFLALLIALVFVAAACGTSGGDDDATTTAAENGEETTTSSPDDEGQGDDGQDDDEGASGISGEALEAILPTAEDLGPGWELDELVGAGEATDDEDDELGADDPTTQALEEACPGISSVAFDDAPTEDQVSASFLNDQDLSIDVELGPVPTELGEDGLDDLVDALASCGEFEIEDEGTTITVSLQAERSDDYGDYGARIEFSFTFAMMGQDLSLTLLGNLFAVGDIAVSVGGSSGFDDLTGELVEAPADLVEELSAEMEDRVRSL